jgi:excisionase family DNA binding protein
MSNGAPRFRTAEAFIHGVDGPVVVLDGMVCAGLDSMLRLDKVGRQVRKQSEQLFQVILAIRLAGIKYAESSSSGTVSAPQPEPVSQLKNQPNSDTVSSTTAATILGITSRAVTKAITENRLPARKSDGRYRITRQALTAYKANRRTHHDRRNRSQRRYFARDGDRRH